MNTLKLLFVLTLLLTVSFAKIHRKQLAGPPSTFNSHEIVNGPISPSNSAFNLVHLRENMLGDNIRATIRLSVDNPENFEFTFGSPLAEKLELRLVSPSGKPVEIDSHRETSFIPYGSDGESIPADYYILDLPESGYYVLEVFSNEKLTEEEKFRALNNDVADAFIIAETWDDIAIEAMLLSPVASVGKNVGLKAHVTVQGKSLSENLEITQNVRVEKAILAIRTPTGLEIQKDMHDDGLDGDEVADDHFYSAQMELDESGDYQFEAIISGFVEDKPFMKTVQVSIPAAEEDIEFTGTANMRMKDSERSFIDIDIDMSSVLKAESELPNYRAYTEVYGTNAEGNMVPVSWIGSIINIEGSKISLEFHLDWANMAEVMGPLVLKNTYLVNLKTEMVVASFDEPIAVRNSKLWAVPEFSAILGREVKEITREMREGVNPLKYEANEDAPTLLLIHGYCAASNPFPTQDFTDAAFFLNANANLPTDDFAQKVIAFTEEQGMTSFGAIGHSQGGLVATHMLNYYFTGLDSSSKTLAGGEGKKIQTIGTPWKGCTGAGSIANLIKIFGVACGENSDLTTTGASNWLAGISAESRAAVSYYTTTYDLGKIFGDWCSLAVNLVLQWPNDGTTELDYAKLDGAINMGNTKKQCHTTDMGYPAQYLDSSRNQKMNTNAARTP